MHFDSEYNEIYFTRPERHVLGIGLDQSFPLDDIDDIYDAALRARHEMQESTFDPDDMEVAEALIIELADLQDTLFSQDETEVACTRFVGCAAMSQEYPFTLRRSIRRRRDMARIFS